jgi:cutinase
MTQRTIRSGRRLALTLGVAAAFTVGGAFTVPFASAAEADACSDVELVFARGTGDVPRPLGTLGGPLSQQLTDALPDKTVTAYGVNYAAASDQSSDGDGATDMSRHIIAVAAECADTQFVIGGYSQGASVTDIAVAAEGSRYLGTGETIPVALAPRIAAVVVFGNPLSSFAQPLEQASALYGAKTKSLCGTTDTVCAGSRHGNITGGHLSYRTNGAVTQAAEFAASQIS